MFKPVSPTLFEEFQEVFRRIQEINYYTAKNHGFQEYENNPLFVPTKLALIASEVSEALEAHRTNDHAHIGEELADIVIRTMDLAQALNIDLASAITQKSIKNSTRPYKHGGKRY